MLQRVETSSKQFSFSQSRNEVGCFHLLSQGELCPLQFRESLLTASWSGSLLRCDRDGLLSRYPKELRASHVCFSLARKKQVAWGELAQGSLASTESLDFRQTSQP